MYWCHVSMVSNIPLADLVWLSWLWKLILCRRTQDRWLLCLFQPKEHQLVIMMLVFSNEGWSFRNGNYWMTWFHSLGDDHSVPKRSMTGEKKIISWIFCAKCTTVLKCDLCHLMLNSIQGCRGWEEGMPGSVCDMLCFHLYALVPYCNVTLCALKLYMLCCCFIDLVIWFGVSPNWVTESCFCNPHCDGCTCFAHASEGH